MALIDSSVISTDRPAEIGRIQIGRKGAVRKSQKGNEFQPPEKLEHFLVNTSERGPDGNFLRDEKIHAVVGDAPTMLEGVLVFPEVEQNFLSALREYKGRGKDGLIRDCDGVTWVNPQDGKRGDCKLRTDGCKCKPYSRLRLQLIHSGTVFGFHVFRTHGWNSTGNIQNFLLWAKQKFGTLEGMPVVLRAYPSEDVHDGGNTTSTKVSLELNGSLADAALLMGRTNRAIAGVQEVQLLPPGDGDGEGWEDDDHDAAFEIIQDGERIPAPSKPQAVDTSGGEAENGDAEKAKPLPTRGKKSEPKKAPIKEEPAPFDRDDARKRFFATLKDAGVAGADRKKWVSENGLPESTKDWGQKEFDEAQEKMIAPFRDPVIETAEFEEVDLEELSVRVLGKPAALYLKDWKALKAVLETGEVEGGSDGEVEEEGTL